MKDFKPKKKTEKRKIGDLGESIAIKYLESKGFKLLERNYLKPWGEIDIICKKGNNLYFIEVKTVTHETSGFKAEENVHPFKLRRLERTINSYLLEKGEGESDWQMDLIVVILDKENKKAKVKYIEGIF
ncbi:MAG: YraN family protein [Patescibacteria group bacterium]